MTQPLPAQPQRIDKRFVWREGPVHLSTMSSMSFSEKLARAVDRTGSLLCVGLDPDPSQVPERFLSSADPLLAWNRAIVEATAELACAYKPNIAFYQAMGQPGYDLLRKTLAAMPPSVPVILDAKVGDIGSTGEAYAQSIYDCWGVDAVTVNPYMGGDTLEPFLRRAEKGVFVLCHTSNPGAGDFQSLLVNGRPLYEVVAERSLAWNRNGNVGLVIGATYPERLRAVRTIAPETWFLVPGVGAQGGDLNQAMAAGLTGSGNGVLVNVGRSLAQAPDMVRYTTDLHAAIRAARQAGTSAAPEPELTRLALALYESGCVQFGQFTLRSGKSSPIYIDLRLLVSDPGTLNLAAAEYSRLMRSLTFDRIAAIPYAALPIGTAASMALSKPLIYTRKEVKEYGTRRNIEGSYQPGETVVVLDDLITTGGSKVDAIEPLEAAGLHVRDVVVLIDREQGGAEDLAQRGYRLHAVIGLRKLLEILQQQGRISAEQRNQVLEFLAEK